jgi:ATP/maltotriose-dependent transcriptional regulator MalT
VELVGRAKELATVDHALDRLDRREGGWLDVLGEPGIGKSALLSELDARADGRGFLVLGGRGAEYERDVPFGAVLDALDDYLASLPERRLEMLGRERLVELVSIFPSLEPIAGERASGLQVERYRLHYAVRALLSRLAADRPLVLVLDDVHWIDDASEELLAHLLRRRPEGAVLLVTAMRPRQAPARLGGGLETAVAQGEVERIELAPLSSAESAQFAGDRASDRLYEESGGNPFYLEQLLRGGTAGAAAAAALPTGEEVVVPAAVRASLAGELAGLSPSARVVLDAAAVAGEPFEPDLAAEVAAVEEADALAALDELLSADLVRPTTVPRRFRFRHPIVRRAVYESAAGGWRLGAHARAAAALEARDVPAALRAHHVERAAKPGDEAAIAILTQAGHASAARAPASAARWFESALRLLPDDEDAFGRRLELLVPLAQAEGAVGRLVESRDALLELLRLLPPDLTEMRGRIAAFVARIEHPLGRHGEARAMLERALGELPDPDAREGVALRIEMAADYFFLSDFEEMRAKASDALEAARAVGDPLLVASASSHVGSALSNLGRARESGEACDVASEIVDGLPDDQCAPLLETFWWLGWTEQALGRFEDSARHLRRGIELSRVTGQGYVFVTLLESLSVPIGWLGQLEEAGAIAEEATEAALLSGNPQFVAWAQQIRCWLACRGGDTAEAVRWGEAGVATLADLPTNVFSGLAHAHLGAAYLEGGDAERGLAELMKADEQEGAPLENHVRTWWADLVTRARIALGDVEGARITAERAWTAAEQMELPYHWGVAWRARAAVALATGEHEAARDAAIHSIAACEELPEPIGAARARILLGRALAALGDAEAAEKAFTRARAELSDQAAGRYADEAAQELRRLGRRVPRRGRVAAGKQGVAALSGREREIAELVGEGKTNKAIAAELFLSEKTIESHLSRVFSKLGVSSRAAVAGAIAREEAKA